jgi:hypothetical protein
MRDVVDDIEFFSDFDSANLASVVSKGTYSLSLSLSLTLSLPLSRSASISLLFIMHSLGLALHPHTTWSEIPTWSNRVLLGLVCRVAFSPMHSGVCVPVR